MDLAIRGVGEEVETQVADIINLIDLNHRNRDGCPNNGNFDRSPGPINPEHDRGSSRPPNSRSHLINGPADDRLSIYLDENVVRFKPGEPGRAFGVGREDDQPAGL